MITSKGLDFVRKMKAHDHVIMFYSNLEDKYRILFTYLKAGSESGEVAIHVTS